MIDTHALWHNAQILSERAGGPICVPLKANAYGHDLGLCAKALAHHPAIEAFAVAVLAEAINLRYQGIDKPIWLLEGFTQPDTLSTILEHQFTLVLHHSSQIDQLFHWLETHPLSKDRRLSIWLKVDTGMHRLGLEQDTLDTLIPLLQAHPHISLEGLMTHYACADDPSHPNNRAQGALAQSLSKIAARYQLHTSFANSAALLSAPSALPIGTIARPGLSVYGLSPFANKTGADHQLLPVMRLTTSVIALRVIAANEAVGYGHTWCTDQPIQIATIGLGYGDGFARENVSGWPVAHAHGRGEIVGRVSMDMTTVAFALDHAIQVGDEITIFGTSGLAAEALAAYRGSVPYTVTTMITERVARLPHAFSSSYSMEAI